MKRAFANLVVLSSLVLPLGCGDEGATEPGPDARLGGAGGSSGGGDVPQQDDDVPAGGSGSTPVKDPEPEPGATRFRLMTLNLHCLRTSGTPYSSNAERFEAIARAVNRLDIDAIALQEICVSQTDNALSMLTQALSAATVDDWDSGSTLAHIAWQGTAEEAEERVGLVARGRIDAKRAHTHIAQSGLTRVMFGGVVHSGAGPIRVVSVHLDHLDLQAQLAQAREVAAFPLAWTDGKEPLVVAGDFNAREDSPTHEAMLHFGYADAAAELANSRIDHIFVHETSALAAMNARLEFNEPTSRVSDHPAAWAEFVPAEPDATVTITRMNFEIATDGWLYARGDGAPLDWDAGWPVWRDAGKWRFVTTAFGLGQRVEYKALRDDAIWQSGGNSLVMGGATAETAPTF